MYFDTFIAGFGGQGIMLMGNILAYAAMAEKKKVTYMPVYGVEMRGGTANCTIVISDREIGSPVIHKPLNAVLMNRPSLEKYGTKVRKKGCLFLNSSLIPDEEIKVRGVKTIKVPTRELALEAGNERLANMVILGALIQQSGVVDFKSLKKALFTALDPRYHRLIPDNLKALEEGANFVKAV
jgi:2-oxoglutarate ferredoxin oxidoreductase subunit gamma